MPLTLDIETVPLAASMAAEYPLNDFAPPANYKAPDAIVNWHDRNAKDWAAKREKECSVNPRLGRILCFGYASGRSLGETLYAETEADEPQLLRDAWALIASHGGRVVTWNGGFDLRFLVIRSLAHGILPYVDAVTIRAWFRKYDVFTHYDVKAVLMNWDVRATGEGLDEWAKFFGLPGKPDGVDGGIVAFMYRDGNHEAIREYCISDVANTKAMYEKTVAFFGGN